MFRDRRLVAEYHAAAKLLKRMLAKGISKYHPDPIAALAAR